MSTASMKFILVFLFGIFVVLYRRRLPLCQTSKRRAKFVIKTINVTRKLNSDSIFETIAADSGRSSEELPCLPSFGSFTQVVHEQKKLYIFFLLFRCLVRVIIHNCTSNYILQWPILCMSPRILRSDSFIVLEDSWERIGDYWNVLHTFRRAMLNILRMNILLWIARGLSFWPVQPKQNKQMNKIHFAFRTKCDSAVWKWITGLCLDWNGFFVLLLWPCCLLF